VRVMSVLGARPQFIKAAMVSRSLKDARLEEIMVHTGQHYDYDMSRLFFEQLGLDIPPHNLEVGSGSHGAQTGRILEQVEALMFAQRPDMVLVYGDTNSTIAGALAAAKLHIPVAHVEAGLRSFNRAMPEEINRVVTDHLSDLLFVPTDSAVANLRREGIPDSKIVLTGDVMLDSVKRFESLFRRERDQLFQQLRLSDRNYFVATVHRAENTDEAVRLEAIVGAFQAIADEDVPVVWPVHPRTRKRLGEIGFQPGERLLLLDPIGYIQMQALLTGARGVLTDSGGIQKEAAFHGVPTVTLRDETEWPETINAGCNVLVGASREGIVKAALAASGRLDPPAGFGDGHAAARIAASIVAWEGERKAK
jgi:UDP-GlcNAc3NAcA epimerase